MIGKKLRLNDYKLTFGQETINIYMYGAFKNKKNGNKYAIYSYENKNKLYYGSFFQRGNEVVILSSKENPNEIISEFVDSILNNKNNEKFEIISLNEMETIQIIDEYTSDKNINIKQLHDITIPKPVIIEKKIIPSKKRPFSIAVFFFMIFIGVVIAFFIFNPEVIIGKDKNYICTKNYIHKKLPAVINEEISLTFSGKSLIKNINITTDYIFNSTGNYREFKDKSHFYKYMEDGDTYKFIDDKYTYRVFSSINTKEEYLLPTEEKELLSYYQNKEYTCKVVNKDE